MLPVVARPVTTDRLVLLPLAVAHAAEMAVVLADPDLHAFVGGDPATPGELRSRYERLVAGSSDPDVDWLNWVLRLTRRRHGAPTPPESCLVGTVQATVDRSSSVPVAEVAWVVGSAWQRQGLATEAARGLVGWLRRQGIQRVIAHIHPGHHASASVATAAGLVPTDQRQDGEVRWILETERRHP